MAENNFGLRIGLEGEKDFKRSLSEINNHFKVLGSEMKLVASQFDKNDNSTEALTARNKVLAESIEEQKRKIEMLQKALQNSSDSFGENDKRTLAWQTQLNNAKAELNNMVGELNANNAALKSSESSMGSAGDAADKLGDNLESAGSSASDSGGRFEGLKEVLSGLGSALMSAAAKAAELAIQLGKSVVSSYADYEQLVGGVETLFGAGGMSLEQYAASVGLSVDQAKGKYDELMAAQSAMLQNADNAFMTTGLSANAYIERVTGFSASLISSLDGDTKAAAAAADQIMVDMADNANKMGFKWILLYKPI